MVGAFSRAPCSGPARRAADPESGSAPACWRTGSGRKEGGDGAGRQYQSAPGERLSSLRVRPLGPAMEEKQARGDVVVVRFADDFVVGFEHRVRSRALPGRAARAVREVRSGAAPRQDAPDRVRPVRRPNRRGRGGGKPETFDFLGFTHSCAKTRAGKFTVLRQTMRKRWQAKLKEVKTELRRRMHDPIPEQGAYLRSVVARALPVLRRAHERPGLGSVPVCCRKDLVSRVLRRRSQRHRMNWTRMRRLIAPMASQPAHLPSLSSRAPWRRHPR